MNRNKQWPLPLPRMADKQTGFGLIEVLVALIILAVGLLGMASLQTTSLKQTTGSQARTQAMFLAEDLVERIRANRPDKDQYVLTNPQPLTCDTGFSLSNSAVAGDDLDEWRNSLACLLPGGNGEVAVNDDRVTVSVTWSSRENVADLNDGELTLEVAL